MSAWAWTGVGLVGYVLAIILLRPHGAEVLRVAAGGTREGAFLLGLLMWAVPIGFALVAVVRNCRHWARGRPGNVDGNRPWFVAAAVTGLPLTLVPVLGTKSASDTPFELSPLFDPFLIGFSIGIVLLFLAFGVVALVRRWAERIPGSTAPPR